ncbi:unnamed protein product [Triticum turgidum subsp. durum]|uniref:Glycosyltransferase n=1 Tax=Triticum turgidum subsp. durum TaxID=4567 RepID=A0A9R0ZRV2_TRITD|nr:unnamed protein product [Triticum turgidum subsp. durum]
MAGAGRRRVVFFPFPFLGHFNPVLRLAGALHARGLAVTVFHTEQRVPDPADYPADYRFVSLPVEVPPELVASEDIARMGMAMNDASEAPFRDRLAALLAEEAAEDGGVLCVITDVVWYSAQAVARELGVPALGIMTASAAIFRVYMAYQTLIDKAYLPVQGRAQGRPSGGAAAVPCEGSAAARHEPPRGLRRAAPAHRRRGAAVLGPHNQHPGRHRGRQPGADPRGPVGPGVRRRPSPQTGAVGQVHQPGRDAGRPRMPRLARHAGARQRALRELREPGRHGPARVRGAGVGAGPEQAAVRVGRPAQAHPRVRVRRAARRARGGAARARHDRELGAAGGGAGAPGGGRLLHAQRLELHGGGDRGGRADDLPPAARRPVRQRQVRGRRVEGGRGGRRHASAGESEYQGRH